MDHPVVKWTLNPKTGHRRWTESEADVVLEDLRTNVWVYDDAQEVEKKEDGWNEGVDKEQAGRNEEEREARGGVVAAVFGVAPGLVFGGDEANSEAEEVPPLPDGEIMQHPNEDAETNTGNQATAQDFGDSAAKVILIVARPRSYTCGRCSEGIDLDSTFYRCVGHLCRGAFKRQSWII